VNLDLVTRLESPWMLVADIERGGVFGSVVGTFELLTEAERRLCLGFAINRFRGDASLFEGGVGMLEARTSATCLGVFPYAADLTLDAEDSLAVDMRRRTEAPTGARLAIVRLPSLSNATDFRLLTWADWIAAPPGGDVDVIILPGSKHVIADLEWMHATGLAAWIRAQHARGATVVGICGGYQMLGRSVRDPQGVESPRTSAAGLELLPADTILEADKVTRVVSATTPAGRRFSGYEIHLGRTSIDRIAGRRPFATLEDGTEDGIRLPGLVGTYLHGALESPGVVAELFGLNESDVPSETSDYGRLADWFDSHVRHRDLLDLR
jgi:adenosylcobyric acid synthase